MFKEYNITRAGFVKAMEGLRWRARDQRRRHLEALSKYARDSQDAARQAQMDPVIGRDAEIRRVIRAMAHRMTLMPSARAWANRHH